MKRAGNMNSLPPERLWIFDFDGTLSSLEPKRFKAALNHHAKRLLLDVLATNNQHVAVLSNRPVHDLLRRVNISGVCYGGYSGIEWRLPGKTRRSFAGLLETDLRATRKRMMCELSILCRMPGVAIEDKKWSITIRLRGASPEVRNMAVAIVSQLDCQTFQEHDAIEIPLIRKTDKRFGVSLLCDEIYPSNADNCHLIYAGDDEDDKLAMVEVLSRGGIVLNVGDKPLITDAIAVASPQDLAITCRKLFNIEEHAYHMWWNRGLPMWFTWYGWSLLHNC